MIKIRIKEQPIPDSRRYKFFKILGWIGVFTFGYDYVRLNGLYNIGKSQYSISILGSTGSLLIPALLVIGMYEFGTYYQRYEKISVLSLLPLVGYAIPCILNSGRESFIYIVIGILSIFAFCKKTNYDLHSKGKISIRRIVTIGLVVGILFAVILAILNTSVSRFGQNEIKVFLNNHNVPAETQDEAHIYGAYQFLFYNVISYFGHQLPFIEYILHYYKGPYLLGMYELNLVSRRLPSFLGLDYRLVYESIDPSLYGSWQTVLGSFTFDFGIVGSLIACCILGLIVGRLKKKFSLQNNMERATLNALICISMFTTIQLGPFYNFLVYGTFFWWVIIFRTRIQS